MHDPLFQPGQAPEALSASLSTGAGALPPPQPIVTEAPSNRRTEGGETQVGSLFPVTGQAQRRRVIPMRSVVCYECGRVSEVPQAALSAHCVHCKAHVALGDVTLFPGSAKTRVRTQGDVRIHPRAVLSHLDIACHRLDMLGVASGNFRCTGALTVSSHTVIDGSVEAHSLHLRKKAHVTLRREARVHDAYISGILEGNLSVTGTLHIAKTGQLLGDARAAQLLVEPGGVHRGHHRER